jgi:hypothetical protein
LRYPSEANEAKYTKDLMKKFNMAKLKPVSTPMSTATSLGPDEDGEDVDQREYRSIIGSLLYLRATWPDIQFCRVPVCMLSGFPTLLASDGSLANLQVSQTHT